MSTGDAETLGGGTKKRGEVLLDIVRHPTPHVWCFFIADSPDAKRRYPRRKFTSTKKLHGGAGLNSRTRGWLALLEY